MKRHHPSVTLLQASKNSPSLAKLMDINRESNARLRAINALIPATLRHQVQAGSIEEGIWCLLLSNNITAAKLRQLLPAFESHLRTHSLEVRSIRLKIRRQN